MAAMSNFSYNERCFRIEYLWNKKTSRPDGSVFYDLTKAQCNLFVDNITDADDEEALSTEFGWFCGYLNGWDIPILETLHWQDGAMQEYGIVIPKNNLLLHQAQDIEITAEDLDDYRFDESLPEDRRSEGWIATHAVEVYREEHPNDDVYDEQGAIQQLLDVPVVNMSDVRKHFVKFKK